MNVIRKSTWTMLLLGGDRRLQRPGRGSASAHGNRSRTIRPRPPKAAPPVSPPATGDSKKGDEAPKIEGPKAENSKPDGGAVVAHGRRACRRQGTARSRTGCGEQARRLPGEHSPSGLHGQASQGDCGRPNILHLLRWLRRQGQERSQDCHRQARQEKQRKIGV